MAYVFNKINGLVSNGPTSAPAGLPSGGQSAIVGSPTSISTSTGAQPEQSTFKNPSNLIQANLSSGSGNQTGLNTVSNLNNEVQSKVGGLNKENQDFNNQMAQTRQGYDFNQNDLNNLDKNRLAPILNPNANIIGSTPGTNVNNYNVDKSSTKALGSEAGVSSLLQNQYGYGSGSGALDALLYRGSGQAANDLRGAQSHLQGFADTKTNILNSEAQNRADTEKYAVDQGNALRSDLTGEQAQYKKDAQAQADAQNAMYQRGVAEQIARLKAAGIDPNTINPQATQGNAAGYLNPRFNKIAEILGTNQEGAGQQAGWNVNPNVVSDMIAQEQSKQAQARINAAIAAQGSQPQPLTPDQMQTQVDSGQTSYTPTDAGQIIVPSPNGGYQTQSAAHPIGTSIGKTIGGAIRDTIGAVTGFPGNNFGAASAIPNEAFPFIKALMNRI